MTVAEQTAAPSRWADIRAGIVATIPVGLAAAPFGMVYAVTALAAGLNPAQTLAMSLIVFAGASQFTAAGLFAAGAGPLTIIITTLIINARHLLLSASLAPHLRRAPAWLKSVLAFQLTDETFAIGISRFLQGTGSAAFQFGANLALYILWQCSTLLGIVLGQNIPDPNALGLDLVFPLTFIGLLVPLLRERANQQTAILAALIGVAGMFWLPGSWYVLLAGATASALGAWLSMRKGAKQ